MPDIDATERSSPESLIDASNTLEQELRALESICKHIRLYDWMGDTFDLRNR